MEECEKCGGEMKNLGNLSGITYTSDPVQWDDVYVCDGCKTKKTVRKQGETYSMTFGRDLDGYKEIVRINNL